MMNRYFIALEIPEDILDEIISVRKDLYDDYDVRWEKKEKLHITLKFLGDVEYDKVEDVLSGMKKVFGAEEKINCSFTKFGMFYRNNKPSILWAGIDCGERLTGLAAELDSEMNKLGFEKEKREFRPHLTILRLKGGEDTKKILEFKDYDISDKKFTADKITLFQSELLPQGSHYTKIETIELK